MAENSIFLKFIADADMSEADKALEGQKKEIQGVIDKMTALSKAALEDEKSLKEMGMAHDRLTAALERNAKYYGEQYKELKKEVAQRKKSIVALEQNAKAMNLLANSTDSARKKLNDMRNLMAQMEDAGNLGEAYERVAVASARLTDQMSDLQKRINVLASDTKNLDAAMNVGTGIAGAFNIATSAAALLGGESEKLQQAFLKVQAAMAILNGVQQVSNVLNKDSAASIVIGNALMKIKAKLSIQDAAATGAATKAQLGLNAAMLANPVIWLVAGIAAVVAGLTYFANQTRTAKEEVKDYSDEVKTATDRLKSLQEQLDKRTPQQKWTDEIAENTKKLADNNAEIDRRLKKMADLRSGHKKNTEEIQANAKAINDLRKENEALEKSNEALSQLRREQDEKEAAEAAEKAREAAKRRREEQRKAAIDAMETRRITEAAIQDVFDKNSKGVKVKIVPVVEDPEEGDDSVIEYFNKRKELGLISEETLRNETLMGYKILESKGIISHQEFLDLKAKLDDEYNQRQIENAQAVFEQISDFAIQSFNVFHDAMSSSIQAQMDQLEELYTTDAKEAQKDADKKYITEKELAKKKAELAMKQQRLNKAAAMFDIALNTASAIMRIWADVPKVDFGVSTAALTAMAAAIGAAQLAAAAAKPLPQYAKGRKGGKGEVALVGEKGPELMYVPAGASIVPNSKIYDANAWGAYGIPKTDIPAMPNINGSELAELYGMKGGSIDYDKLGKAVANNMPKLNPVNVSVDRNGVTVQDGRDTHTYLNTKYNGSWN